MLFRSGQSLGDGSFGCRCLVDAAAGPATILRAADTQDPEAGRHEVEHLTDALTNDMERATALRATVRSDINGHFFARQMFWKSALAQRRLLGTCIWFRCRQAGLDYGDVGVEIFKAERQLIGVKSLRLPPELVTLQLLDDLAEPLDFSLGIGNLPVIACHPSGHRPHHLLELIDVGRQCSEINVHAMDITAIRTDSPSSTAP